MQKGKLDIPNLYLSSDKKAEIQMNAMNLARDFSRKVHEEDEKLRQLDKMTQGHDDTIYR